MKRQTICCAYRKFFLFVALSFFFLAGAAFAANGKITGKVVDAETHEAMPGVNVIISGVVLSDGSSVSPDHAFGASTDADGYYFILNIPPGEYSLTAKILGYTPVIEQRVRVEAERTITVNFSLQQSAIQLSGVEVVYRQNVIKADVAGTQEVVHAQTIQEAPMTRVDEFVGKLQGVELVDNNQGHGLSIRGGAIRETDVRLDDISLQDPRSENSYLSFNSTTIQELQVMTGGFQAKYGGIQSGLVNAITKEGSRQKYNMSLNYNMTPGGEQKFFGTNPWSNQSMIYQVFTGKYAMHGIRTHTDSMAVPSEFWGFKGWADGISHGNAYAYSTGTFTAPYVQFPAGFNPKTQLDSIQRMQIWQLQHPQYSIASRPDYYFEGSLTGPVPGGDIPLLGEYFGRTTFLLGVKYEDTQFAYPIGSRDNYVDWNAQLKLTTQVASADKLTIEGMYANVNSLNTGRASNFSGVLQENSSSYGFLTNTQSSVEQQALLIGGGSFPQIYNISRMQLYDQRFMIGGAKYTHTISPTAFYTLSTHFQYNSPRLSSYSLDTTQASAWYYMVGHDIFTTPQPGAIKIMKLPAGGTPNGSTNYIADVLSMFNLAGGPQRIDSSYTWVGQLNGDLVWQFDRHNQFEAGFSMEMTRFHVYAGTWLQSQTSWTPDLWQYYNVTPISAGLYLQDKLEFEGMIANLGVRVDYWDPNKDGFTMTNPPSPAYTAFYNDVYSNLPGGFGSYQKWLAYEGMIASPPGWPTTPGKVQVPVSPRLSVSFPITESSKLYFNYGHFYQRPPVSFLYDLALYPAAATVPSPNLTMGKTISYEFGYEQSFLEDYLATISFYYKDVRNQPLPQTYVDYYHENEVTQYIPDAYTVVEGLEMRFDRTVGRFVTFWANYNYMLQSYGQSGLAYVYENLLEASDALRSANITTTIPKPRAHVDLNLHTPPDWGLAFSSWYFDLLFDWRSGGKMLWNPQEPDFKKQEWVDVVDYTNLDLRLTKTVSISDINFQLMLTVQNVLNEKRLDIGNMTPNQLDAYKNSLHLPFNSGDMKGNDKWGDIPSASKQYINVGWWTAPIFLNPRRILLGLKVDL
ncbi:MAG: TonB-dependent receptor [Bacteroidota bacterium]|nr:TonB-dependent receptor [Bacteroidota bacterium]